MCSTFHGFQRNSYPIYYLPNGPEDQGELEDVNRSYDHILLVVNFLTMPQPSRGPIIATSAAVGIALAAVIGVVAYHLYTHRPQVTTLENSQTDDTSTKKNSPETHPSSAPSTTPSEDSHPHTAYMDVVRASYPAFPTTQPLAVPLDLSQAARLVLTDPIYLNRIHGDLWITRNDALPIDRVLRDAVDPKNPDPQSHVIDRRVLFVHWMPDDSGVWPPYLVCPSNSGPEEIIWQHGHASLPTKRDFKWDHAWSWNEKVVVPSSAGTSIFTFGPQIKESYQQLIAPDAKPSDTLPQALLADADSLLAWAPWEHGVGSRGAFLYVDGRGWSPLGPDQNWPEKIAYLVPLL